MTLYIYLVTGRGSGSPCLDVFITLLSLGKDGYMKLCSQRKVAMHGVSTKNKLIVIFIWFLQENYIYLKEKLIEVCVKHGERVLETSHNPISLGLL